MRAIHYLIDCHGKTLPSPFQALRQALINDLAEHALVAHAVERLGYVHVQDWPRGLVVFYRRRVTSPVTLAGVIYLLAELPDKRVVFSVADRHARYSICRSRAQAIGRLAQEMRDLEAALWQTDRTEPDVDVPAGSMPFVGKRNTT
jgi:hypothetical protein